MNYFIGLILAIPTLAFAVSIASTPVDRAVKQATQIAYVRIIEGHALFFKKDQLGRTDPCGGVYKAKIIKNIKGNSKEIVFGINFNMMLVPGSEYLLFLDNDGGLGIEGIMFEKDSFNECTVGLPKKMARWRYSSIVENKLTEDRKWGKFVSAPYSMDLPIEISYTEYGFHFDDYISLLESLVVAKKSNQSLNSDASHAGAG